MTALATFPQLQLSYDRVRVRGAVVVKEAVCMSKMAWVKHSVFGFWCLDIQDGGPWYFRRFLSKAEALDTETDA